MARPALNGALLGTLLLMGGETCETAIVGTVARRVYRR